MLNALIVFAAALATVFVGMAILTAVLFALRHAANRPAGRPVEPSEPVQDDEELIAVLAAAAHTALGKPVRVHRVHVHRQRATELWSRAGRMDIMVSHRVEPKR